MTGKKKAVEDASVDQEQGDLPWAGDDVQTAKPKTGSAKRTTTEGDKTAH